MKLTLSDLIPHLSKVKRSGNGYTALCPCHNDSSPSLSVGEKDGKLLAHCFACGAGLPDVLDALGLTREAPADKPSGPVLVAEYFFGDQLKKCKYRKADGSKYFVWYHREGNQWRKGRNGIDAGLYRNGDLSATSVVYIVEGEKDVDTLREFGLVAVCLPDGANSRWCAAYEDELSGKDIIILPDNDKPGKQYAELCATKLIGKAVQIRIVDLSTAWPEIPEHGDISDIVFHFGADAMQKLTEQVAVTPNWKSAENSKTPRFKTISAVELLATDYPPREFLIDELLPTGTTVFCGPSKIGKSWMILDLGLCIAAGLPFWGHNTHQCGVLYLAMEDSEYRLKRRLQDILQGRPVSPLFRFQTEATNLGDGLLDFLAEDLQLHPQTRLIVIDTFQIIRGTPLYKETPYAHDYREIRMLKQFADQHNISIVFVHHNRKQHDDDAYNMISGTTGIMGASDTAWVITRDKRSSPEATLHIIGRDTAQHELCIRFDAKAHRWQMIGSAGATLDAELRRQHDNNPIVQTVRRLLDESKNGKWSGSASQLMTAGQRLCGQYIAPTNQKLGLELRKLDAALLDYDGIIHDATSHGTAGSTHHFYYAAPSWVNEAEQQELLPL